MKFGRVMTAMITPFDKEGEVSYERMAELSKYLIENGSDSLLVTGTTGESPTLTTDEKLKLFETVKRIAVEEGEKLGKKIPVIAGTGSNNTRASIEFTKQAEKLGMDGALVVVPYYNKPSQEGMYRHFASIAEASQLPVIMYNIPGRTGINMLPETIARLSEHENIVAVKEAAGSLEQVSQIMQIKAEDFEIYSGDDSLTLPMLSVGAEGVISVASHIMGSEINRMCREFFEGNVAEAEALHRKLYGLFKVLFVTTNPVPVKYALGKVWKDVGSVRLPLCEMGDGDKAKVDAVLGELGLI